MQKYQTQYKHCSNNPAAAIGDINKETCGTAREAITGSPPLPNPTVTAAKTAIIQKIQWSYMIKLKEIIKFRI